MMPSKLELHSLIVFYFVASEKSITSAAEKLCLTQPTVTYHIKSLEKNTGQKLIDIRKKRVFLTQAGSGLFGYANEIYQQMVGAEKFLEGLKDSSLRVGISATFSPTVAAAASAFKDLHPDVKLIVRNATSFEVAEDVLDMRIDLGIVVSMDYKYPKIRPVALSRHEKLVLVASPSSAIFQKVRVDPAELCSYPLVSGSETSAARCIILSKLKSGGCLMPTPIIAEVNSLEWGLNLVENGKGMGFYHIKSVEREISDGRLKELSMIGDIYVGADALLRIDIPEHPMAGQFINLVKREFENHAQASEMGNRGG
jgi:DNA-binding transcriptional LysR family regulator